MGLTLGYTAEKAKAAPALTIQPITNMGYATSVLFTYTGDSINILNYVQFTISGGYGPYTISPTSTSGYIYTGTFNLPSLPAGYYTISATAYNPSGLYITQSEPITVTVGISSGNIGFNQYTVSAPTLSSTASSSDPVFTATVSNVSYSNSYNPLVGFVYSTTNVNPSTYTGSYTIPANFTFNSNNYGGTITSYGTASYANFVSGQTYYIWAYYIDYNTSIPSYSSSSLRYEHQAGRPSVTLAGATTNGAGYGEIYATGTVTNIGTSTVTDYGFVASSTNSDPRIGATNTSKHQVTGSITYPSNFTLSFTPQTTSTSTSSSFYVRAYATNGQGTNYSNVMTVTGVPINQLTVNLGTLTPDGPTKVNVNISVSGVSASQIYEWGVAWSETSTQPTASSSNTYKTGVTPTSTLTTTVAMENLKPNTKYNVRAYARTQTGSLIYSTMQSVTTQLSMTLTNYEPVQLEYNQFTLSASLDAQGADNQVAERGFVYSRTNQQPTEKDTIARYGSSGSGSFSVDVGYLSPNSTYYYRSYVRLVSGTYMYSSSVGTFKTTQNMVLLDIFYKDANGYDVGSQMLDIAIGTRITFRSLNIPSGYRLQDQAWAYNVVGNDAISVYVVSEGGTSAPNTPPAAPGAPGTPTGPALPSGPESVYMNGIGGGMFGPNEPGTVFEVASMLYNILADPYEVYYSPIYYPDVDPNYPQTLNIVNFVTAAGYMSGNENGLFRPNATITRAEVAMVICHVKGLLYSWNGVMPAPGESYFPDVPQNRWDTNFINLAYWDGVFSGYPDGTFGPNRPVTKAELASIFAKAFNRSLTPFSAVDFLDVPSNHWAYNAIMNAAIPQ
jgi:hypothetical protein